MSSISNACGNWWIACIKRGQGCAIFQLKILLFKWEYRKLQALATFNWFFVLLNMVNRLYCENCLLPWAPWIHTDCISSRCHLAMGSAPHRHVLASKRGIWHQNALDCCTRHQRRVEEQQGAAAVALDRTALATTGLPPLNLGLHIHWILFSWL
jgi:hypothetical protein